MKAVLVTGANSGIGRYSTRRLAANGFYVYAGVRKEINLNQFKDVDNIQTIKLDVTSQDEIDAAVVHIQSEGRGLYGIVNNAGIQRFSDMNSLDESELYEIFNTNVFGVQRINKAFVPMLDTNGRTVAIGSISAFRQCSGSTAYGMSKAALSSYTDSYAGEAGVYVSIIEPGGYNTNILRNANRDNLSNEMQDEINRKLKRFTLNGKDPHEVAEMVLHVMTADKPKRRYMVVPNEQQAKSTIESVLAKAIELNSDYDLIVMLQKLLDESSSE